MIISVQQVDLPDKRFCDEEPHLECLGRSLPVDIFLSLSVISLMGHFIFSLIIVLGVFPLLECLSCDMGTHIYVDG